MHPCYSDIVNKLGEPQWWDEHAVPRYCEFSPDETFVYADEVALLRIACQACGQNFRVAMSSSQMGRIRDKALFGADERPSLRDQIVDGYIHYGDPPNYGCCPAGPTMNCDDLEVLEYWHRDPEWERDSALEIRLPDGMP